MQLKIKDVKKQSDNILSLILEKPEGFSFYAGQYLDVELPANDPLGNTRAFTISSSPTEEFLMISPKKGISKFKKFLQTLKVGDKISTSHPVGTFTLDESSPAIFIAGGIGITPFRSIIKYALDQKFKTPITLIYSNSDKNFPFKKELEEWRKKLSNLKIDYVETSRDGRLDKTKIYTIVGSLVNKIFYLAGAPKMVDDFAKMLLELGVDEINIRYDRFDGY